MSEFKLKEFTPINRWPKQNLHLRNIEMALEIAGGKTYAEAAKIYKISANRVLQIYRIMAAKLYSIHFNIPYPEVFAGDECYQFKGMKELMRDYHLKYIHWMTGK